MLMPPVRSPRVRAGLIEPVTGSNERQDDLGPAKGVLVSVITSAILWTAIVLAAKLCLFLYWLIIS